MPSFKTPEAMVPATSLDTTLVHAIVAGLLSPDPGVLKTTVYQRLHPSCTLDQHFVKAEGRWEIWRVLRASAGLFDTTFKVRDVFIDSGQHKAMVWVDQFWRPRVPLRSLLPQAEEPTLVELKFVMEPGQGLLIKDIKVHVSTFALSGLPVLSWAHHNLLQPLGTRVAQTVSDGLQFGTATARWAERQFKVSG